MKPKKIKVAEIKHKCGHVLGIFTEPEDDHSGCEMVCPKCKEIFYHGNNALCEIFAFGKKIVPLYDNDDNTTGTAFVTTMKVKG